MGTPGRVIDHLKEGALDLSDVKYAVLDEADEMLNMGFKVILNRGAHALSTYYFDCEMNVPSVEPITLSTRQSSVSTRSALPHFSCCS